MMRRECCSLCDGAIAKRWPWWEKPPRENAQDVLTLDWGYVLLCENNHFDWEPIRPSDAEILGRKSCFIPG